jgi:hypothetical protein
LKNTGGTYQWCTQSDFKG